MLRWCFVLLLAASGLAACGGSSQSGGPAGPTAQVPNAGATVSLKNISFNPSTVTIQAGQAVVWNFRDGSVPHDVTGPGYASVIQTSGSYVHAFTQAGTYKYSCTIHSGMNGTVIVSP